MIKQLILLSFLLHFFYAHAQLFEKKSSYNRADTLRGGLRKERNFNVKKYGLNIRIEPNEKRISGVNVIEFVPEESLSVIQIDLFANLKVDSILYQEKKQKYVREYNAVFISFSKPLLKHHREKISFYYSGYPTIARKPPWDGGFIFSEDSRGQPWIATACQGTGASIWYPCKDHPSDEPDEGANISITVPSGLKAISNGRLVGSEMLANAQARWDWQVTAPINNYDIALNIGDYVHFGETYKGLNLNYYVLKENLDKAKKQFQEVKPMLDCFQEKFGEYPFKKDGYKLVETPYLGMEHQSAIAYGNQFENGYLGHDLSHTGLGLKFDFIIIHESGHEWFGNSITAKDIADMWIQEAFTTYAESVYVECRWGYGQAQSYLNGYSLNILNNSPILGDYNVSNEGSADMYGKGALMLNTLRHVINNDATWSRLLRSYATRFKYKIIGTEDVIDFFEKETQLPLRFIFYQYIKHTSIPTLELQEQLGNVRYRWQCDEENFAMPIDMRVKKSLMRLNPSKEWQSLGTISIKDIQVETSKFYVNVREVE